MLHAFFGGTGGGPAGPSLGAVCGATGALDAGVVCDALDAADALAAAPPPFALHHTSVQVEAPCVLHVRA